MDEQSHLENSPLRLSRMVIVALYLYYLATIGRTLAFAERLPAVKARLPWSLGLEVGFILLFSLVFWQPKLVRHWLHGYFILQCAIAIAIFIISPELDFITNLFVLLSAQVAIFLTGRARWVWIGILVAATGLSLILIMGLLRGLGIGTISMVVEIVFAAYVITNQEVEAARTKSQTMLLDLQETHQRLKLYAGQVEELAGIQERNRLARELHDSVSQTMFSIALNIRSSQLLLEKDPSRVRPQLEQLQTLVQSALAEMRSLITQLRVKAE